MTTTPTDPKDRDEYNDSAEAIDRLLKGQHDLKRRPDNDKPPATTAASEALQRQALEADSKRMLVIEELAIVMQDALKRLPDTIEEKVKGQLSPQSDRLVPAIIDDIKSTLRDALPRFNDGRLRYLIHVYGSLTLLILIGGILFLIFIHR